ncbi:M14 family metallopeptidase [Acinetobacter soli]|uniref:M14 family metallopeptidase n=1 Tax=Acinetobacter soli TaxID=487316 RepID=UPI002B28A96B|nr:M14 family metallopeptidase [Acinetobacter soli]
MATNWNAILSNTNNLQDVLSILKKVLAQLDIKVDETTVDEALAKIQNLDADVNEKLGVLAQELTDFEIEKNQAFQDLLNSGGFRPFPTEVDLKAYTPTTSPVAAYAFDTKKVWLWNGSAWIDEGTSALDVAKDYSDQKTSDSNQLIAKKLNATFDFYTFNIYPSIIEINEAGQVLGTGTTTVELTANLALSQAEYLSQYQKYNQLNFFDFYTYSSFPDFIQINDSNQIIGTGTTEKDIYAYDFYTFSEYPDLLFVDSKMKILKTSTTIDAGHIFDSLPASEKDAVNLYLDQRYIRRARNSFHQMYYQANNTVIPLNQAQVVYDFFDNLMSNNSNYITKSQIGVSTLGLAMYQYKFTPPPKRIGSTLTQSQVKPVRIMINAGIHGSEKNGIIAVMCIFENLVNHWREYEMYDDLRMHCEFVVTPMMNIDGTNAITRKNANGVDCNRNFDWNWSIGGSTDPASDNYRGSAAFSEVESRNYRDTVLAYPNADLYIDVHHGGEAEIMWLGSNLQENIELLTNVGTEMSTYFHKHINPGLDPQTRLLYITGNGDGTAAGYLCSTGKSALLFEGVGSDNANIQTVFNARRFNELCLLKIIYSGFMRTKYRREILIN